MDQGGRHPMSRGISFGLAAALAAALFHPDQFRCDAVIAVTTGGNVDPAQFARALETL